MVRNFLCIFIVFGESFIPNLPSVRDILSEHQPKIRKATPKDGVTTKAMKSIAVLF